MYNAAIAICLSNDYQGTGILESILEGFDVSSFADFPYATLFYYTIDGTMASLDRACCQFLKDSKNFTTRAFLANRTTAEFKTVLEIFDGLDILVISLGSSYTDLSEFVNSQNGISMNYADRIATQCLVNLISDNISFTIRYPVINIIYEEDSLFQTGYKNDLLLALRSTLSNGPILETVYSYQRGDIERLNNIINVINTNFQSYDIIIFLGDRNDIEKMSNSLEKLPQPYFLYGTDILDGCQLQLSPTIYFSTFIQAVTIYTQTTSRLYAKLYAYPNEVFSQFSSYLVPFAYDFARQMYFLSKDQLNFTKENFQLRSSDPFYALAALQANWISVSASRPIYARYYNIVMYDNQWSQYISTFNRLTLGSSHSQPLSTAMNAICGFSGSLQLGGGWFSETIQWIEVFNVDGAWIFTKLSSNSLRLNTSIPYRNNYYQSVPVGTYILVANPQQDVFVIRKFDPPLNDKFEVISTIAFLSYPPKVNVVRLSI